MGKSSLTRCFFYACHHRVAACRALGWTEIDALVIEDASHLQSELIEIDENLCRAELTASQRTGYTKRRKQIWEALHPEDSNRQRVAVLTDLDRKKMRLFADIVAPELEVAQREPLQDSMHGGARPHPQGFASSTAEITGESKATINRHIARADALGDDVQRITGTSLDSGVEMDALAKLDAPERTEIIDRAVAGEQVSARQQTAPVAAKSTPDKHLPIRLYKAAHAPARRYEAASMAHENLTGATTAVLLAGMAPYQSGNRLNIVAGAFQFKPGSKHRHVFALFGGIKGKTGEQTGERNHILKSAT